MSRFYGYPVLLLLWCWAASAAAGNIFFGLEHDNRQMVLTNRGDSIAYYPEVFRLLPDGRWESLSRGDKPPTELLPGSKIGMPWRSRPGNGPIETTLPIMVRFFDQAGSGFGQISFFNQPAQTSEPVQAGYEGAWMVIRPPEKSGIRASWVLWPQEEGIRPLTGRPDFVHVQPAAHPIVWQPGMKAVRLFLGEGLPMALLLHETDRGYELQVLASGGLQGRQQRTWWLDAGRWFYGLAAASVALALILASWGVLGRKRKTK